MGESASTVLISSVDEVEGQTQRLRLARERRQAELEVEKRQALAATQRGEADALRTRSFRSELASSRFGKSFLAFSRSHSTYIKIAHPTAHTYSKLSFRQPRLATNTRRQRA